MSVESERIKRIKGRWESDGKISSADVKWLIDQAQRAETMRAAGDLRRATQTPGESLLDGLFGR